MACDTRLVCHVHQVFFSEKVAAGAMKLTSLFFQEHNENGNRYFWVCDRKRQADRQTQTHT